MPVVIRPTCRAARAIVGTLSRLATEEVTARILFAGVGAVSNPT